MGGRRMSVVRALTAAADAVAQGDYPYVYGGGHAEAGTASIGIKGPGYNGRRVGFDCSGAVGAVLAGAGLLPAGTPVPNDAGVIVALRQQKLIAPGVGHGLNAVTFWDHPGVHIFMSINGRYFGTSDGGGGNSQGGPTWLDDSAPLSYSHAYRRWHFQPSVLRNHVIYGHSYTFQTVAHPELVYGAEIGDKVSVNYAEWPTGSMGLKVLSYAGAMTITGTVATLDGATLTVQTPSGSALVFDTSLVGNLTSGVQIGDGVQITYSKDTAHRLIPHALQVTSTPPPITPSPSPAPPGSGDQSTPVSASGPVG
jgi:hypothetical protein